MREGRPKKNCAKAGLNKIKCPSIMHLDCAKVPLGKRICMPNLIASQTGHNMVRVED